MASEHPNPKDSLLPQADVIMVGSKDLPNGSFVRQEINVGERILAIEGFSRIGEIYSGIKKNTEDGSLVVKNTEALLALVVDGGTQVDKVSTLDAKGISGGTYIKSKTERHGQAIEPSISIVSNLRIINRKIGQDTRREHPTIDWREHSHNTPYGSIAGVRIDLKSDTLEVANAGDVFVVAVNKDGNPMLLSRDDVYKKDQQTFSVTKRLAEKNGVTFRHAMQNRTKDERFHPIVDETFETMRRGNTGEIRRITGAPNFDVTSSCIIPLEGIWEVILFTDGTIPGGVDIHNQEGLTAWYEIIRTKGVEGLNEEVLARAASDPDFDKYPRFGNVDDLMLLKISLSSINTPG